MGVGTNVSLYPIAMSSDQAEFEFQRLLVEHTALIHGFIRSIVLDANDAQDVFQETAVILWQKYDEFEGPENFPRWALAVARNKALQFLTRQRRNRTWISQELIEKLADPPEQDFDEINRRKAALTCCIERLSAGQQELLQRCYDGSETVSQVAAALRRTPHSIYSSLRHIRVKLLHCVRLRLRAES